MPIYNISTAEINISRNAALVDTGVLVAAFYPGDGRHDDANTFLNELHQYALYVPIAVVIETWGILVGGQRKYREGGINLMAWLNDPGHAVLIPQYVNDFSTVQAVINSMHVDCIDAILLCMATDITDCCQLNPPIGIATYDTRDFLRCRANPNLRFNLVNAETLDEY